jgi:hypothetical protein
VVVDEGEEGVGEKGILTTGDTEMMLDVGSSLGNVEGCEMVADGDALAESFIGSKAEPVSEVRLAEEDEGEQGGGIHLVVEQEAELVEEVVREKVSLVDNEESEAALYLGRTGLSALASQIGEGSAELGEETGKAEGRLGLEGEQDLMVEGGGRQVWIGEVDDSVEVAVEGVGESAQGGGLAGTDIAGDKGRETFLEGKGKAALDLLVAARREEIRAGYGLAEGSGTEAIEVIEGSHCRRSPVGWMVRVARSE